ncbi:MAG: hypothetical protein QOD09_3805 [Bradyrhizobium sp.]|nr:hypothetical protein [Bradyrhizobium sp.]
MPGLVPGIHVFAAFIKKMWMAGTSPAMTENYTTDRCRSMQVRSTSSIDLSHQRLEKISISE